jgi:organic anion transporter 5A
MVEWAAVSPIALKDSLDAVFESVPVLCKGRCAWLARRPRAEEGSSCSMLDARCSMLDGRGSMVELSGVRSADCIRWRPLASTSPACLPTCMPAYPHACMPSVARDPENQAVSWCVCPCVMEGSGKIRGCDGWLDGWMAGWLDGWMVGWLDGWMVGWLDGWMVGWMNCWMGGGLPHCIEGWLGCGVRDRSCVMYGPIRM